MSQDVICMNFVDEKDIFTGICENCKKENVKVRRCKIYDAFVRDAHRGYVNFCLECFRGKCD